MDETIMATKSREALRAYITCKKDNSGVEPESFFERWARDYLRGSDGAFVDCVWRGFIRLLAMRVRW